MSFDFKNHQITVSNLNLNAFYSEKFITVNIPFVALGSTVSLALGSNTTFFVRHYGGTATFVFNTGLLSQLDVPNNSIIGFSIILQANTSNGGTIVWPTSIRWPNDTAPAIDLSANRISTFSFLSLDNGSSWLGFIGASF